MDRDQLFPVALIALIIFLSVTLGVAILSQTDGDAREWSLNTAYPRTDAVYVGANDTFITMDNKELYAIGPDGALKWRLHIPETDGVATNISGMSIHRAATDGDTTYFLVKPTDEVLWQGEGEIVAVSADGRLLWNTSRYLLWSPELLAANQTLYFYNTNGITAYGPDGTPLWNLSSIYTAPEVDELGCIYAVQYQYPDGGWNLKAYDSSGALSWDQNLSDIGLGKVGSSSVHDITYHKGTLYVFINNGMAAFDRSGDLLWTKNYDSVMWPMGFDSADRIYVSQYCQTTNLDGITLTVLTSGGDVVAVRTDLVRGYNDLLSDGILYNLKIGYPTDNHTIGEVCNLTVSAYDVVNGKHVWDYTIVPENPNTILLDEHSAGTVFPWNPFRRIVFGNRTIEVTDDWHESTAMPGIANQSYWYVAAGKQLLYVSYWTFNYEYPLIRNESKCACAGGIYAFDKAGRLVWEKPTDSYVKKLEERNGTVYYETSDGRFSAVTVDVAAGLLAVVTYLVLRLFVIGSVTRARSRIDKNPNRNSIYALIGDCPGMTHHELARQLSLNLGTVRYHLAVLTVNHKITAYADDTKFIRYFKNSHSYSEDEKRVIALVRREPIRKLLVLLLSRRCSSNIERARALDMPESAVSKYLRELVDSGVVVKNAQKHDESDYMISERYASILQMYVATPESAVSSMMPA